MSNSNSAVLDAPETQTKDKPKSKILPPYNVILMNDDDHSVVYVINMLKKIFGYSDEKGAKMAKEIHETGRCIVWTGTKELGELKQEQIHSYGPDKLIARCKGSMTAILEPSV